MKKTVLGLLLLSMMCVITGCVTTAGGHSEITSEYERYRNSLPPADWEPTGVPSVDDIGILSVQLYEQTYNFLQEYISATENNRYYIGLMNEVDEIKKNEGLEDEAALEKAFNNIAEADKNLPEGSEPALPHVIEGYNAVQALSPLNKLQAITPMFPALVDLTLRAKHIPEEVATAVQNDPFTAIPILMSAKNVLEQLYHTQKMLQYVKLQYERNQEMKKYMQD